MVVAQRAAVVGYMSQRRNVDDEKLIRTKRRRYGTPTTITTDERRKKAFTKSVDYEKLGRAEVK